MLIPVIAQYLGSHRRLIIPQMGAFIVKEPGRSVLFSELLKRDDGVLRSLLVAAGSSELEAGGEIDRFVFEVRHAIRQGREFPLEGLGVLKPGPNETIAFVYHPQPAAPVAEVQASEIPGAETSGAEVPATEAPAAQPAEVPAASTAPIAPTVPATPAAEPQAVGSEAASVGTENSAGQVAAEPPVGQAAAAENPAGQVVAENAAGQAAAETSAGQVAAENAAGQAAAASSAGQAASAGSESPAVGENPPARKLSAAVETLYGNPENAERTASGQSAGARPAASAPSEQPLHDSGKRDSGPRNSAQKDAGQKDFGTLPPGRPLGPQYGPLPRSKRSKRGDSLSDSYYGRLPRRPAIEQTVRVKKRSDHFLWIALIAALIALGAIAFGQWCDRFGRDGDEVLLEHVDASGEEFLPPAL